MTGEPGLIAHDLFWWRRDADGWRTMVSILWPFRGPPDPAEFRFTLHGADGEPAVSWKRSVAPGSFVVVDSDDPEPGAGDVESGVLSVEVFGSLPAGARESRVRLYGLLDWYHPQEGVVSLHSDHCVLDRPITTKLTEMVVGPDQLRDTELVFLTGPEPSRARSLSLTVRNDDGASRDVYVDEEWPPYRVNRVRLTDWFQELEDFGQHLSINLSGRRETAPVFERPYVVSHRPAFSGYHGGDRYSFAPLPGPHHFVLGEGEVNPMFVIVDDDLTTEVDFFNSHGDLDSAFWIGVRLYDLDGTLVAHEPRWRRNRRDTAVAAQLRELLPPEHERFVGHAAFTFSEAGLPAYPRRLQALMTYRSHGVAARVMAWSDEWNTRPRQFRLGKSGGHYDSYYRAWTKPFLETWLAITNAGDADYSGVASYELIVRTVDGAELRTQCDLAALATAWVRLDECVDGYERLVGGGPAMVFVESTADLAMVALTRHKVSGTWSAEHLMGAPVLVDDGELWPTGG